MKKHSNTNIFQRFFGNNVVLFVSSLVIACVIWFVINANSQTDTNVTIADIPITVELPEDSINDGLEVFSGADTKASVDVSGNRLTVGSLKNTDIQVVALQSNSIIAPGNYSLELSARKLGVKTNYNIVSDVSPSVVSVFVDRRKEKTFDIKDEIVYKVSEGNFAAPSFTESSVTVTGPETEISSIDKVVVQGEINGEVDKKVTERCDLLFFDKDGNKIDITMSALSTKYVDVTLSTLPQIEVKLTTDVINAPEKHPSVILSPSTIKIAAEKDILENIDNYTINIGTVDFSKLTNTKNVLNYDIALPNGCKNISNVNTCKVSVDLSSYISKKVTVNKFEGRKIDLSKYNVSFNSKSIEVTVYGPKATLNNITSNNIVAYVDLSDKVSEDSDNISLELPISFEFSGSYKNCWVYGDYSDGVGITKK